MENDKRVMFRGWGRPNTAGVMIASSMTFSDISHEIDNHKILYDISLQVNPAEVLCLLGPSGSGKTSLLRIAAGLDRQTSGRVLLDEREIAGKTIFVPPEKRGIGLVFQDYALFPHLNIIGNVKFGLTKFSRKAAEKYAMHVLKMVGMEGFAQAYPHEISGGEQQRVALARALAPRPGILLMDEPFCGLDARLRDHVRAGTLALLRETRATAVIVTHDPEEALRVADHIALMRSGRVVQYGTCDELYHAPINLFVASFFSELNLFYGKVVNSAVDTPLGKIPAHDHKDGTRVDIGVRQTDICLTEQTGNKSAARVRSRRVIGTSELIELQFPGHEKPIWGRTEVGKIESNIYQLVAEIVPGTAFIFRQCRDG